MGHATEYIPTWRVRELIGTEAADALLSELGGQRVYLPRVPKEGNRIVELIGLAATRKLAAPFTTYAVNLRDRGGAGCTIELPRPEAHQRLATRREFIIDHPEMSERSLASHLGVHGRTVRRIRAAARQDRSKDATPDGCPACQVGQTCTS